MIVYRVCASRGDDSYCDFTSADEAEARSYAALLRRAGYQVIVQEEVDQ